MENRKNGDDSWRRFLDGDEKAFDAIIKEHFDYVVFFVDWMLHDTFASEDIAIDVFAYLAFRRGYDGRSSMRTYLLTVARSRALNYLKKQKGTQTLDFAQIEEDESDRAALEETVLRDERKKAINEAIAALPPEMQSAVRLVYFEDLTYAQAAKVMKKSVKQIDNLLYRAKNDLHALLGEEGRAYL